MLCANCQTEVECAEHVHRMCNACASRAYHLALTTSPEGAAEDVAANTSVEQSSALTAPVRQRLPDERAALTRSFEIRYVEDSTQREMKLYLTAGTYHDGTLGEVFIKADKAGSMARGTLDAVGVLISLMLQHGVPIEAITSKLRHTRYQPSGFTGDGEFPSCSSVLDLLAQWLERRFIK